MDKAMASTRDSPTGGLRPGHPWEPAFAGITTFMRRPHTTNLMGADVVISGVAFDNATTGRPGCRFGPRAIRAASMDLADLKSFPWGFDPFDALNVIDAGDCAVNHHLPGSVEPTIVAHAERILASGASMLTFGGDHYTTYPVLKAHARKHGAVALLQFDAHCDTWTDGTSDSINHGTMFLKGAQEGLIDVPHSVQVGLRTHNDDDHGFEILTCPWVHRNGVEATIAAIKRRIGDAKVYLSFDIDVLDPAFAPGTGTPVAGGLATWQALEMIRGLGSLNIIGMDVVEVSPPYDHSEITAIAAATIAHDYLCLLAERTGLKPQPPRRT
jgi:agmatinase